MYAIIKTGGKQYKVQAGDVLQIEKVEQALGSEFTITEILMVGGDKAHFGAPLVKNASVTVVVTKQAKTRKVLVFKKKRRQGYRKFAISPSGKYLLVGSTSDLTIKGWCLQ